MATNGTAIIGADPVLISSIPVIDTINGLFWERVWEGSDQGINLLLSSLNPNSDEKVTIDASQSPLFKLTVLTPDYTNGQSSTLEKFDLIRHDVEKSIMEHPKGIGLLAGEAEILRQLVRDKVKIEDISF